MHIKHDPAPESLLALRQPRDGGLTQNSAPAVQLQQTSAATR